MALKRLCSILLLLAPVSAPAAALFDTDEVLEVTIRAPLQEIADGRDNGEYYPGHFVFADGAESRELDVRLRARGNYRRQVKTCSFPPLRLNFKKKDLDGTLLDGQDKLKLVTHCRTRSPRFEQQVLKEYLAYRMFRQLTEKSFDVRLLRITWVDTADPDESFERYGFLIEDEKRMAKRLGLKTVEIGHTFPAMLVPEQSALVGLFQYLIGNTDFSMLKGPPEEPCCHNTVLLLDDEKFVTVPYDFDFSGLVDAPYAAPNPILKIRSVKTRLYRGRCPHNELVEPAFAQIRQQRDALLQLVDTQVGLTDYYRKSARKYVEKFFTTLDDTRQRERRLIRKCI